MAVRGLHHVFPETEDADRTHRLVNDIAAVRIWCLIVIGRYARLARVVGLSLSRVCRPF